MRWIALLYLGAPLIIWLILQAMRSPAD
jgi:hypothetical protein